MINDQTYLRLRGEFYRWLEERGSGDAALDGLLAATRSRATGLWERTPDRLILLGFRGVPAMPESVKREFARATADVALTKSRLAIVSAAVTGEPCSGTLEEDSSDRDSSASWLARFEAIQSLAAPIRAAGKTHGVLAVSSAHRIEEGDAVWTLVTRLANSLAPLLQEREQKR